MNPAEQPPDIVEGLTRLATWIQSVFKITCSKQTIKNWQKELPPFPNAISADYRYKWSEVADWVQRYKVQPLADDAQFAFMTAKLQPERVRAELEEIEHDRMMRDVERGKYLKKADVERACMNIGKTINGVINNRLELVLRVVVLERLNGVESLDAAQREAVLNLFCQLGRETSAVLKSELKVALNSLGFEDSP